MNLPVVRLEMWLSPSREITVPAVFGLLAGPVKNADLNRNLKINTPRVWKLLLTQDSEKRYYEKKLALITKDQVDVYNQRLIKGYTPKLLPKE